LLRSNTNPHYHQIQQLQVLPATRLQQAQLDIPQRDQQRLWSSAREALQEAIAAASAATAAASSTSQHLHHHQHHHSNSRHHHREQLLSVNGSLTELNSSSSSNARQLASSQSAPADVASAAVPSVLQPYSSSSHVSSLQHLGLSHSSKSGTGSAAAADALSAGQLLALCGAVVEEDAALATAGIQPLMLASLCLIESGGCPHAQHYRDHLGDVALGLCQVG
jgi:hypothetical protein